MSCGETDRATKEAGVMTEDGIREGTVTVVAIGTAIDSV